MTDEEKTAIEHTMEALVTSTTEQTCAGLIILLAAKGQPVAAAMVADFKTAYLKERNVQKV